MPLIGHVQIASVPGRNEPGSGELDDFRIFNALDALGYQGFVGCEYRPCGTTLGGLGWLGPAGWRLIRRSYEPFGRSACRVIPEKTRARAISTGRLR
jgi:sugar phosphate isomerase/epimerase